MSYLLLGYFGILIVLLSALMPFVSDRLNLTYGQAGLHLTLGSLGAFLVGTYGDRVSKRFGNGRTVWVSAIVATLALGLIPFATSMSMTLPIALIYGMGLGMMGQVVSAAIADGHDEHRTKAITESNIAAALGVSIGPLLVGTFVRVGAGMLASIIAIAFLLGSIAFTFRGVHFPMPLDHDDTPGNNQRPLPLLFWIFGVIIFLAVSIEWMTIFWTPDFLTDVVGYERSTAATLISVQAIAIVLGRIAGVRLLQFMSDRMLLVLAFAWVLVFYPVYLFSPYPLLNVIGLFMLGLGIGNMFPLCYSGAMVAAGKYTGRAGARLSLFVNGAIILMPNLVGNLADQITIRPAMSIAIVLCMVAIVITSMANRLREREAAPQPLI
ncbi:MAG: MFS transporter [Chloroflexota bacterium]